MASTPIKRHLIIDRDTGEILSRHKRLNGPSSARVWLKAWKSHGFNAVIGYTQQPE